MSRRRDIEQRLALYGELTEIMRAMKNMAQVELHRVGRSAALQERCRQEAVDAATDLLRVAPTLRVAGNAASDVQVLIGSERGFCGGYNEHVVRWFAGAMEAGMRPAGVIVVGERLASAVGRLRSDVRVIGGATTEAELSGVLNAIVETLTVLESASGPPLGLSAAYSDGHEVHRLRLLPVPDRPVERAQAAGSIRINVAPGELASELQRHYVYHALLAALYTSLRAENRMRLAQMEGALQHLDGLSRQLKLRQNAVRQEEIVEEIEEIFAGPARPWA